MKRAGRLISPVYESRLAPKVVVKCHFPQGEGSAICFTKGRRPVCILHADGVINVMCSRRDLFHELPAQRLGVLTGAGDVEGPRHAANYHLVRRTQRPRDVDEGAVVGELDKLSEKSTNREELRAMIILAPLPDT